MISFACPKCGSAHQAPELLAGAKLHCKDCAAPIQVPGGAAATPAAVAPPAPSVVAPKPVPKPPAPRPPAAAPKPAASPTESGPPPKPPRRPAPPAKEWYYELNGRPCGPVPERDLGPLADNGTLGADAFVWSAGLADWQPAAGVLPALFDGPPARPAPAWQKVAASALGVLAACSVAALIVVVVSQKKKAPGAAAVAAAERPTESPAAPPTPTPPPGPAPTRATPDPAPPGRLDAKEIAARFGPAVARVTTDSTAGSGFLAGTGVLVTNSYLVERDLGRAIKVRFPAGPTPAADLRVTVLYEDRKRGLTVLGVAEAAEPLPLADKAADGEEVFVVAAGAGEPAAGHLGERVPFRSGLAFRLDAAAKPGQLGGPVVSPRGRVVGVVARADGGPPGFCAVPAGDIAAAVRAADPAAGRRHDAAAVVVRQAASAAVYRGLVARNQAPLKAAKAAGRPQLMAAADAAKREWFPKADPVAKAIFGPVRAAAGEMAGADADLGPRLAALAKAHDALQDVAENPIRYLVGQYNDRVAAVLSDWNSAVTSAAGAVGLAGPDLARAVEELILAAGGPDLLPPAE